MCAVIDTIVRAKCSQRVHLMTDLCLIATTACQTDTNDEVPAPPRHLQRPARMAPKSGLGLCKRLAQLRNASRKHLHVEFDLQANTKSD